MQRKTKKPKKDFIEVEYLEGETEEILGNAIDAEAQLDTAYYRILRLSHYGKTSYNT
jgi:hypothetical protein